MSIRHIEDPSNIPEEPHLAIIKQFIYYWEGYGSQNQASGLSYIVYDNEEDWKRAIVSLNKSGEKFKAIRSRGLSYKINVDIEIKESE